MNAPARLTFVIANAVLLLLACGGPGASSREGAVTVAPPASTRASASASIAPPPSASATAKTARTRRARMPSGSMIPTLHVGQYFATEELAPSDILHRGDVVVFQYPEHPDQRFVKRIVALEGDHIEFTNARPRINGWDVPRCLVGRYGYTDPTEDEHVPHDGELFVEFLESAAYFVFIEAGTIMEPHQGPWDVARGEGFVLGDNRNSSHDSRFWFGGRGGGVPRAMVKERMRAPDKLTLPSDAEPALQSKLDACLAKRPNSVPPAPPP